MTTPIQAVKRKRAAAKWARAHGVAVPRGLNYSPFIGKVARELFRRIERKRWPTLPTTGLCGTRMLALLFPPPAKSVGQEAVAIASSMVGVKEHPPSSNRGPVVDQFLAACGFHFAAGQQGEPWCACFVTWCLRKAGWKHAGWNLAYVPSWIAAAHAGIGGLQVIGWRDVVAGDLACFDWQRDGVGDHIGFADGRVNPKTLEFPSKEGNTSTDSGGSQSNGGQVAARTRSVHDVVCYIRVS